MFAKPYQVKSNNTLKNSEKKQLVQRILDEFSSVSEERAKELVPVKSVATCVKLTTHGGQTLSVYTVDGMPLLIAGPQGLVPTVCALWKVPEMLPTITIHSPVLPKILGGAPLYLPGVVIPHSAVGFPMFPRNALVACNTADNSAVGMVGRALLSSGDMLLKAGGVCLETINVAGDLLCKDPKFGKVERPRLRSPAYCIKIEDDLSQLSIRDSKEEWPTLGASRPPSAPAPPAPPAPPAETTPPPANAPRVIADEPDTLLADDGEPSMNAEADGEVSGGSEVPEDMDGLLRWCLLAFIRLEGKRVELPLKTNLLYRNHMVPLCPEGRSLDVKKSSFKKMGKFLDAMQQEGLLEVRELEKGVDAVVAINISHPAVRATRLPSELRLRAEAERERAAGGGHEDSEYAPPQVREMLCVTANVADLFAGVKKGTALTPAEVRTAISEHVKARGLASTESKGVVILDDVLAKAAGRQPQELVRWDALTASVCSRMTLATELRFGDAPAKLIKARLEPVTIAVVNRAGNKKVTLVSNLEAYGFSLAPLSTACGRAVGATCGVTRAPGAKHDQLMLQGDQTLFVAKLLIEKYGLPKKFLDGADKALARKK